MLIAHSISTFIAQKYLESYALKGLVLINPVPPVPCETVKSLINFHEFAVKQIEKKTENQISTVPIDEDEQLEKIIKFYYRCDDIENMKLAPFPLHFMRSLLDPKISLNLEKGMYTETLFF